MTRDAPATDLDRAGRWIDAFVECDDVGRMVRRRAAAGDDDRAPSFLFVATRHGNVWRVRRDLPDELVRELCRLAAAEGASADLDAPPERTPVFEARLAEALGAPPSPWKLDLRDDAETRAWGAVLGFDDP